MSNQELLTEIEATIDQLIENASALKDVANDPLMSQEMHALQKTQESLLAHLIHLETALEGAPPATPKKRALLREIKRPRSKGTRSGGQFAVKRK